MSGKTKQPVYHLITEMVEGGSFWSDVYYRYSSRLVFEHEDGYKDVVGRLKHDFKWTARLWARRTIRRWTAGQLRPGTTVTYDQKGRRVR